MECFLQNEPNLRRQKRGGKAAGLEFIDENGGGPGVRLKKSAKKKP
jgi:hypothetical protein